jgi:hypothetical protein
MKKRKSPFSLHVNCGLVSVFDPRLPGPHQWDEQNACRMLVSHGALLAALKRIVAAWESIPERDIVNEEMNLDGMWANARTAIEEAEAKEAHP